MKPAARFVYREWPLMVPEWARVRSGGMGSRRIVGSHFNKDGKPKTAYESEAVARQEAERLGMTYYRCDVCNRYHLASKS
jgi:hypothetical protein